MEYSYSISPAEKQPKISIVKLNGKMMGMGSGKELREKLYDQCADGNFYFLIDLSKLDYVDSSGLSTLIMLLTIARKHGGEAVVVNPSPKVKELFIITKLMAVFNIEEDRDAGIAFLEGALQNN